MTEGIATLEATFSTLLARDVPGYRKGASWNQVGLNGWVVPWLPSQSVAGQAKGTRNSKQPHQPPYSTLFADKRQNQPVSLSLAILLVVHITLLSITSPFISNLGPSKSNSPSHQEHAAIVVSSSLLASTGPILSRPQRILLSSSTFQQTPAAK